MTHHVVTVGVGKPQGSRRIDLAYARNSAERLAALATRSRSGLAPTVLLDEAASTTAVTDCLGTLARAAKPGEEVLLSFSGHGRGFDEKVGGWHLFDAMLGKGQIEALVRDFARGVHVTVVSDCCSGGGLLDGLRTARASARVTAISATGPGGLAFPEQDPPEPGRAVSALVAALEKLWAQLSPPEQLEAKLREEMQPKRYRQVPTVVMYAHA